MQNRPEFFLRQVDFRTACDIMKTWVSFQELLLKGQNDDKINRDTAMEWMMSMHDLTELKNHARRAVSAVQSSKEKMAAIGMLIHSTYHFSIELPWKSPTIVPTETIAAKQF
ncbi:hypothetical protein IV203_037009 [Nitzschia inconspicua]|uniref:Uncharacterized protein n=1 Tax=Nitzschia inconspicua TaxID=303405 RepID=A0A9K3K5U7_9STRA|nr:hypothetical protein IV203_037009 [Nitzschia inconspicua]